MLFKSYTCFNSHVRDLDIIYLHYCVIFIVPPRKHGRHIGIIVERDTEKILYLVIQA